MLPNAIEGAIRPSALITWYQLGTTTPVDLTGATITGTIRDLETGVVRAIAGDLTVIDGVNGVFRWDYDLDDLVPGVARVQFTAVFGSNPTPARTFEAGWKVYAIPVVTP